MSRRGRPASSPGGSAMFWVGVAVVLWLIVAFAAYGAGRLITALGA